MSTVAPPLPASDPTPTPGAPETFAVRSMFDRIAPRYDLANRLLSAGIDVRWRRRAVDVLAASPDARILDLCTGTADLLVEALGRGGRRRGVGLDLSLPMLSRARAKLDRCGLASRAALLAGDAQRLALRSETFDGALVAFGIRNVGDPAAALAELRRVLRPGGRLVVLEFSNPGGLFGALYRAYSRHVLPWLGGWISGDRRAYAYLPASVARFAAPAEFGRRMEEAGFVSVRGQPLTGGIAHVFQGDRP
jgi:demethylmenaquinone methyltransferase / 2-methoxy-6-polyprenyl-1,4-benzoquinol methylase